MTESSERRAASPPSAPSVGVSAGSAPAVPLPSIADYVFQSLPLGLIVFDEGLRALHVNTAAEFLVRPGESVAEALRAGAVESRYENWGDELRRALDTRVATTFEPVTHRDGQRQERILSLTCSPVVTDDSAPTHAGLLIAADVTASIGMEKRLAVSERMAALGKLAARVAHELNNPLDGILRYLGLAQRVIDQNQPDKARHYLEQSRAGLLRMAQIITDLLEFSRNARVSPDDAGLNAVIEEAIRVMSDKAAAGRVSIVCAFDERLPVLRGGGNLFQVFCNIIKNAIDAMEGGGTLTVTSQVSGADAVIRFEDTGPGLPEQAERIFEPFFTTKPPGKGTGLGLPVCREIVEKYGGRLLAENRPTGGARFTVTIPLSSCALPPAAGRSGTGRAEAAEGREHAPAPGGRKGPA